MKKFLCFLATLLLIFTLGGCKNKATLPEESSSLTESIAESTVEITSSSESSTESSLSATSTAESTVESTSSSESSVESTSSSESSTESSSSSSSSSESSAESAVIDEHGSYTSKDDVALYIHTYGRLPENFISKKDAEKLGWSGGSLEPYAPGMCIGGSRFGNYEGLLPKKSGRTYTECDIDTLGKKSRGAKRIVFSNDGLIYYTDDHYESFTLLYGEE